MKDIKLPGFLWVLGIAVAIVLIETYVPGQYQYFAEGAVVFLMGAAKARNLGTQDVEKMVALLKNIPAQPSGAVGAERGAVVSAAPINTKPYEPNKGVRWLLG